MIKIREKNIYRLDSILIILGSLLFAFDAVLIFFYLSTQGNLQQNTSSFVDNLLDDFGVYLAVALILVGYYLKYKEHKIITIWNIVESSQILPVSTLIQSTGFSRKFIRSAIIKINQRNGKFYTWDTATDMIMDDSSRSLLVTKIRCNSCGAKVENGHHSLSGVTCSYCGSTLELDLNAINQGYGKKSLSNKPKIKFSIIIFLILLFIYWPLSLVYFFWKFGVTDNPVLISLYQLIKKARTD